MKYLSVCSGIEAASVAFRPLGWEAIGFAEIEPFPCKLLAHRYGATAPLVMPDPDQRGLSADDRRDRANAIKAIKKHQRWGDKIINYGDFTTIAGRPETVEADFLCGGTPCQSFSFAGLRQSMADDRGNLTLEFVRLADAIDDLRLHVGRPGTTIFWENVPGVLSTDDNAFGCFLAALVGADAPIVLTRGQRWTHAGMVAGPKRRAAWRILDAQYFGLAQRRERVFVIACPVDGPDPSQLLFEPEGLRRYSPPRRGEGEDVTGTLSARPTAGGGLGTDFDLGGGSRFIPETAHALRAQAQAQAQAAHREDAETYVTENITYAPEVGQTLRPEGFDASEDGTGRQTLVVAKTLLAHGGSHGRQDFESETFIVEPIGFSTKDHGADATAGLSPTMRAMNFDKSHINGGGQLGVVSFSMRGRDGENVCEPEAEEVAPALRTGGGGSDKPFVATTSCVRRLMPVECEALQGFEAGYTDIPDGNKPTPDGHRYRGLGNSWATNVVAWLGRRIDRAANAQ